MLGKLHHCLISGELYDHHRAFEPTRLDTAPIAA
jgi:hypothetical protein